MAASTRCSPAISTCWSRPAPPATGWWSALYDDGSVQRRKGADRPVQPEAVRAARVASLDCVDLVVVVSDGDGTELIGTLRPDILAGTRPPAEAEQVRSYGGNVLLADRLPEPSC